MSDVIDAVLADERWEVLRRQRPDYVRYSQGSHDALLLPEAPGGLSLSERAASAWRVAVINEDEKLAAHYAALLDPETATLVREGGSPPRLATILGHVERVATAPRQATAAQLRALEEIGLTPRDIVALSQLIAFVSFQVRVLAGLRLLSSERPA